MRLYVANHRRPSPFVQRNIQHYIFLFLTLDTFRFPNLTLPNQALLETLPQFS
jgi:hypothetical protein